MDDREAAIAAIPMRVLDQDGREVHSPIMGAPQRKACRSR
jgi:hypothetical protein